MKRILLTIFLILSLNPIHAETIQTWLGTGLNPVTTSQYPERDDLTKWTTISSSCPVFGDATFLQTCVLNNELYVFSQQSVYKMNSSKGTFTKLTDALPGVYRIDFRTKPYVFKNKMWYIPEYTNQVWYSSDGASWYCSNANAPFPNSIYGYAIGNIDDTYMYAMGTNNCWKSADGVNWTCCTSTAAYGAVTIARAVTFENKIFLRSDTGLWSSSDGVTWFFESAAPGWNGGGTYFSLFAYNSKLYIYGVLFGNHTLWSSSDGKSWLVSSKPSNNIPCAVIKGHVIACFGANANVQRSY